MINQLADSLREQDRDKYIEARYPVLPDGENVVFDRQDFTGVDFSMVNNGFFVFNYCNLNNSKGFGGQPITINDCTAHKIDFMGASTVIYAKNSDFTGAIFDESTNLAHSTSSVFENCIIDDDFIDFLQNQGVVIE